MQLNPRSAEPCQKCMRHEYRARKGSTWTAVSSRCQLAHGRGLRAARIEAIKAELTQNPRLDLDRLAACQGISPRYVQMLFDEAGTTFSVFVLERRLDAARNMLASPRYAAWMIAAIALEAEFGDLSHFNRRFKQRYGMTPSELRVRAKG
jgi:AraC-like DNA-binding protein